MEKDWRNTMVKDLETCLACGNNDCPLNKTKKTKWKKK